MYRVAGAKRVAGRADFAVGACVRLRMHGCTSDTCDEFVNVSHFRTLCSLFVMSCCDMRDAIANEDVRVGRVETAATMVCVDGRRVTVRRMSPMTQ